jgi:hypothetical protein
MDTVSTWFAPVVCGAFRANSLAPGFCLNLNKLANLSNVTKTTKEKRKKIIMTSPNFVAPEVSWLSNAN